MPAFTALFTAWLQEIKCTKEVRRADGQGPTELRLNIETPSFNGVFIDDGESVGIVDEATAEDGVLFYHVLYGKRRGWIKGEHVH